MFTPKTTIDEYIDNSELNSRIYDVLLRLNECKICQKQRKPLDIFHQAYAICDELQHEKHPEETVSMIWDRLRSENGFLLCETNIIFSCVYVILFFSGKENRNIKYCLTCIKCRIDAGYFREFEPLIREELTGITAQTTDFETIKVEADKIKNLNQRELFYMEYLTQYKQSHTKGDISQQISDEIALIRLTKELTGIENDNSHALSNKVRAVATMELLKTIGIDTAHYDLSKICRLVVLITGTGYTSMYSDLRKGIQLTEYHNSEIDEVNKIFSDLNLSISIDKYHHT
jgi:hypothetical protein